MRALTGAALALFAVAPALAQDGAEIFESNCAVCHEAGLDRAPDRATLDLMAPDRILYALERGVMVSMAVTLSTDQRRNVSEFLSGESLDEFTRRPPDSAFCARSDGYSVGTPDWQGWGGTGLGNHRYQSGPVAGITPANVADLEVKWAFGFPGDIRAFSPPTIANGRLFLGSLGGGVYSLDAETGCVHWFLDVGASVRSPMTLATVSDGGREREAVFFGDGTAIAYAVDAASGDIIWQTEIDDFPVANITGATVYHDGKVFVVGGSGEEGAAASPDYECCRFRGSVSALDADTGAVLWKTYTVTEEPARQSLNAIGTQLWGPSGAPIWSSPAIDPRRGLVYVTTGNNYSNPASPMSDAFIALDMETGRIRWSQQMTSGDAWTAACRLEDKTNCANLTAPDFDFSASPILVDRPDGSSLLIAGQKSGIVHALDPDRDGAIVWQTRVGLGGSMGGVQWGSATDGEKLYVTISDVRRIPVEHSWATEADPEIGGGVVALDLDDGSLRWFTPPKACGDRLRCSPAQPGATTVIDGVAFAGSMTGFLRAYDTATGRVLWEFDSVRSFETVNGVQAAGGAIDGAGPTIANGFLYLNSGYPNGGGMPGNVLIALSVNDD